MDCSYYRTIGSAILDNEASADEIAEFNAHCTTCPDCARWFECIKIIKDESLALTEDAPPELKMRVMKSVAMLNAKKPSVFGRFKFTAVAAVIAIIAFGAGHFANIIPTNNEPVPGAAMQYGRTIPSGSDAPLDVQARSMPRSDMQIMPRSAIDGAVVVYDDSFSHVILLHDATVPDILNDAEFELRDGHKYFTVSQEVFDELSKLPHDVIVSEEDRSGKYLIVIKAE